MIDTIDYVVLANLLLSVGIIGISIWGYFRIGKATHLYFGVAYTIFAITHGLILLEIKNSVELYFLLMRTFGYILVMIGVWAVIRDILEMKRLEVALRESEERLNLTFRQAAVGIAEFLSDGSFIRVNRKFCTILGFNESDLMALSIQEILFSESTIRNCSFANIVGNESLIAHTAEIGYTKKDGTFVWVDLTLSFVREGGIVPKYFIAILQDVTSRKKAQTELANLNADLEKRVNTRTAELAGALDSLEKEIAVRKETEEKLHISLSEKEVLLREIHHRVKNNLQIIISLLSLQEMKTPDESMAGALMDSQMRVKSMALVHEKLYQSSDLGSIDFSGYLKHLVATMFQSYGVDPARIKATIAVDGLNIDINQAIPLGLVMSELVSNSLKHAFPEKRSGEIYINGRREENQFIFTVADTGVGFAPGKDWKNSESLGLRLIATWVKQLRGTVELNSDGMTRFIITIPDKKGRT